MALVVVSLPVLFLAHSAMGLGKPPVFGLIILALTVVVSMAIAGAIGAGVRQIGRQFGRRGRVGFGAGIGGLHRRRASLRRHYHRQHHAPGGGRRRGHSYRTRPGNIRARKGARCR